MSLSKLISSESDMTESAGATVLPSAALGLILLTAQYHAPSMELQETWKATNTSETAWEPLIPEVREVDVFSQINKVYEQLLREQVELDPLSKKALYENLWDLYK